ncbi:hypothetical protein LXL04_011658 [Taraxacum kok-saghyz]
MTRVVKRTVGVGCDPEGQVTTSIQSIPIYFFGKTVLSPLAPSTTFFGAVYGAVYDFILFQISLVCFPIGSSWHPLLDPWVELHLSSLSLHYSNSNLEGGPRVVIFVACSGISTSMAIVRLYGYGLFGGLGLRGFVIGLVYGWSYKTWVYDFPIIQRAPFRRYKLGVGQAFVQALKMAFIGVVCVLPLSGQPATGDLIEHVIFFFASFLVFLCWELNRNMMQVFMTNRLVFAPIRGSENPSGYLLEALEDTTLKPAVRYLAYLDLCMVSETDSDNWRRAPLFERSGETYKRVIAVCLSPLEQLRLALNESNEQPFYELQVCVWGARTASSLVVRSIKEDEFGVARHHHAAVLSTLLSSLSAVEALLGKKSAYSDPTALFSKAYSMAGVLRTSIYEIVWNFHEEMVISARDGLLEQEWVTSGGNRELLAHKLPQFLEF